MALHLVTGYKGNAHITSADQGVFNAGCVGSDEYVLATGRRFEAQIVTSNTVRIFDGGLSMQGRHVNLESGTFLDVTISDGLQSMNRNDLIVVRYTKNTESGIESVSLEVIQGTRTEDTAVDPTYTTGDIFAGATLHEMPLYRVKVSGLNIASVEPMFSVLAPLADLQHSFYRQNLLINGDFQCNQRGSKIYGADGASAYTVDMWRAYQVKVQVLNEGVTLTGLSDTEQGYFTQFIQLGKLKTTTYTIVAMADDELCVFTVTPGGSAKEKNFGKFKISALTTSVWDNDLNDYNNKLKINICPIGTSTFTLTYVDVFVGDIVYPHMKEDPATALMRSRRYIQKGTTVSPSFYEYVESLGTAYRFAITHEPMAADAPTVEVCNWHYFRANGADVTGTIADLTEVGNSNCLVQFKTALAQTMISTCNGIRATYLLTCEPNT